MRHPRIVSRSQAGARSTKMTAPTASAEIFQTPKSATSTRKIATQRPALTGRRRVTGSASQRSRGSPTAPRLAHQARDSDCTTRRRTSGPLGRPLPEQPFWAEDEDQDQDGEDDRLGPVAAGRVPRQAVVVRLDEADRHRAEDGAGKVADATEHGRCECDQSEREAGVVPRLPEVEGVEETRRTREPSCDQEREGDR